MSVVLIEEIADVLQTCSIHLKKWPRTARTQYEERQAHGPLGQRGYIRRRCPFLAQP
jgi:hypothetical protein